MFPLYHNLRVLTSFAFDAILARQSARTLYILISWVDCFAPSCELTGSLYNWHLRQALPAFTLFATVDFCRSSFTVSFSAAVEDIQRKSLGTFNGLTDRLRLPFVTEEVTRDASVISDDGRSGLDSFCLSLIDGTSAL